MKDTSAWLKAALDATSDMIFVKDRDFVIRSCNEQMCKFLGHCEEEVLGRKDEQFFLSEAVDRFRQVDKQVVEKNKAITIEEWIDYGDERVLLETVKSPCHDADGHVVGLIGVSRDITERHNHKVALEEAKEAAEQANNAKSQFLSQMSHEIRTPMNAILGYSEILSELMQDPNCVEYLKAIMTSGKSLLSLINDVLDLSKIEAGKFELNESPTSLEDLFSELKVVFEKIAYEKNIEIVVDCENLPEAVIIDENRLRQVLINLLSNALKFTEQGYLKINARSQFLNSEWSQASLIIEVEDSGVGIPEEAQELIFDSFQQRPGQKLDKYGGTGLGLSISKDLVSLMGGTISLESEVDKGSKFIISFAELKTGYVLNEKGQEASLQDLKDLKFRPSKVLIVDDVDFNREIIQLYLQTYEMEIIHASNGFEAVEKTKSENPDLVLMDMKMPGMDGYEASEAIKADEQTRNTPIIAITASALKSDESRLMSNTDAYLTKPISKHTLVNEILRFIKTN